MTAIEKIRALRALHEEGLLSEEQFEQRKHAILDAALGPAPAAGTPGTELGLMAGQLVGPATRRYRLERLIAAGGMAQVWQATDLATHTELGHSAQVALKILAPELTASSQHARLLLQEATRARRLAHEHIVRVYDWAQDPATSSYFLIMECLSGEDLDKLLARAGALPFERVLALLEPVAAALDYAWERHGLVHRDIKPANVFVTARGEVKLLDFGIAARARQGQEAGQPGLLDAPALSGTPGYRAPEAGTPGLVPARTLDVHAVARMAAQMLLGVPAADLDGGAPGLDVRLWDVLSAGWSPDPAARPPSVAALLARLRAAGQPAVAEPRAADPADPADPAPPAGQAPAPALPAAVLDPLPLRRVRTAPRMPLAPRTGGTPTEAVAQRLARRAALHEQLAAHRAEALASAHRQRQERERQAQGVRAAAAYLAEQERLLAPAAVATGESAEAAGSTQVPAAGPALPRDAFRDGGGEGPELVLVGAGRFQMGSLDYERKLASAAGTRAHWLAREAPAHWVGIARPFALGRYPVTVGEWGQFVAATGWRGAGAIDWAAPGFAQTERHPVVGVSWDDAQAYLAWLGARTGARYRLPSEAEWEYACRAGGKGAFSWGEEIDTERANYDGRFVWNGGAPGEFRGATTPVGRFPANAWGLYDMHGNVWEWVQDVLHENYEGAPGDGAPWEAGGDTDRRVLRGGCWRCHPRYLRSALRNGFPRGMANDIIGFRVARELDDLAAPGVQPG